MPTLKFDKRGMEFTEEDYASLSPTVLIYKRHDDFITRFQELHDAALTEDLSGNALAVCFSALRHAYLPIEAGVWKKEQKAIDAKMKKFKKGFNDAISKGQLTPEKYRELYEDLFEIAQAMQKAMQMAGMGVRKEHRYTSHAKMDEAMLK